MKIVLFNCKYSPNLGDGLLSEALEERLRTLRPDLDLRVCDLAGRSGYGHVVTPGRRRALTLLGALPPASRRQAVRLRLAPRLRALRARWAQEVMGADLAVIGGGHLFQDGDLNFPLKVGAAFDVCIAAGVPVAVHAVGVSENWSRRGRALFGRLLATECVGISVRDAAGAAAWARHFAGTRLERADIVPDPVLAADMPPPYPSQATIGLNVTHPVLLSYHGGRRLDVGTATATLCETAKRLRAEGHAVVLFTNGAAEDEEQVDRVMARLHGAGVTRAPRPRVPQDLVRIQTNLRAVIAHRLHANIVAYRLALPAVGLGWDPKLESFYDMVGRPGAFVPAEEVTPESIVTTLHHFIAIPHDAARRDRLAAEAQHGIERLLAPRTVTGLAGSERRSPQHADAGQNW